MRARAVVLGLVLAGVAVPAHAATLEVRYRDVWMPNQAEPTQVQDIVYDGAGSEANNVTVAALPARQGIVLTDPGTPIQTTTSAPYVDPLRAFVGAGWTCATPGSSIATCLVTPGQQCWSLGCSTFGPAEYRGRIKIAGNQGNDTIRILPGSWPAYVWGVWGDDTIDVSNGVVDDVSCGPGNDVVTADTNDIVDADCETVNRG